MHVEKLQTLKEMYPWPDYEFVWCYHNRVLIRRNETPRATTPPNGSEPKFHAYVATRADGYRFVASGETRDEVVAQAKPVWGPPKEEPPAVTEQEALDHIHGIMFSLTKKDPTGGKLKQADLSYVYWGSSRWRAFYPSIEKLLEHHLYILNEPPEQHTCHFCECLRSDEFRARRAEWDKNGKVVVEQKQK